MELELQKCAVTDSISSHHISSRTETTRPGFWGSRGGGKQTNKRRTSCHQLPFYSVCVCTCWGSVLPNVPAVLISHNPAVGCTAECDRLPERGELQQSSTAVRKQRARDEWTTIPLNEEAQPGNNNNEHFICSLCRLIYFFKGCPPRDERFLFGTIVPFSRHIPAALTTTLRGPDDRSLTLTKTKTLPPVLC